MVNETFETARRIGLPDKWGEERMVEDSTGISCPATSRAERVPILVVDVGIALIELG